MTQHETDRDDAEAALDCAIPVDRYRASRLVVGGRAVDLLQICSWDGYGDSY